jgi:hypothetical protein
MSSSSVSVHHRLAADEIHQTLEASSDDAFVPVFRPDPSVSSARPQPLPLRGDRPPLRRPLRAAKRGSQVHRGRRRGLDPLGLPRVGGGRAGSASRVLRPRVRVRVGGSAVRARCGARVGGAGRHAASGRRDRRRGGVRVHLRPRGVRGARLRRGRPVPEEQAASGQIGHRRSRLQGNCRGRRKGGGGVRGVQGRRRSRGVREEAPLLSSVP